MFIDLVKKARSHRGFRQDRPVTRQELGYLVECARYTPSARNDQVLKYYLANDPETVARILPLSKWAGALAELHLPRKGAEPVAFIVICLDSMLSENPAPYQRDVGIVAQTMLLAAAEMGLTRAVLARELSLLRGRAAAGDAESAGDHKTPASAGSGRRDGQNCSYGCPGRRKNDVLSG